MVRQTGLHRFFYEEMCDVRLIHMFENTSHLTAVLIHAWHSLYIIEQRMASSQFPPIHKRKNKKGFPLQPMTAHGSCSSGDGRTSGNEQRPCKCSTFEASSWWTFELLFLKSVYTHSHMHVQYVHAFEWLELCCKG